MWLARLDSCLLEELTLFKSVRSVAADHVSRKPDVSRLFIYG